MLAKSNLIRAVFTLAVALNLFLSPWWLTFAWCVAGVFLFPLYIEAIACIVLFDSVFAPGGFPALTAMIAVVLAVANIAYFYSLNNHVDLS